jgi:hypothetical protein
VNTELIVKDISNGRKGIVERLFDLEFGYGQHALVSNDMNLAIKDRKEV